jgi:hypothetical protein
MIDTNKTHNATRPGTPLEEYRARIEKRLLYYLAVAARRNRLRFVRPSLENMKRATGCPDIHLLKRALLGLVTTEKITMAEATTAAGEIVRGFTVLAPKARKNVTPSALNLTLEDQEFLHDCGIAVDAKPLWVN